MFDICNFFVFTAHRGNMNNPAEHFKDRSHFIYGIGKIETSVQGRVDGFET